MLSRHETWQARRLPSGDDDAIGMDKESEELFGDLPADLPFKDDELFGIISGDLKQEHGNEFI